MKTMGRCRTATTFFAVAVSMMGCAILHPNATGRAVERFTPGEVRLGDGAQIAYYVREGRGPCVVLIPGSWGDWRVYDGVVANLPSNLKIVIVELRGHGRSQPPTLNGSIELFADDVSAVVDALELKGYYVGGHSIGGMIAIEIAGREPDGLEGAIGIEGWTHHTVLRDAFEGDLASTLGAEQQAQNQANRDRVQRHLTKEQIDSFGAVWRRWDGSAILESTSVPILEIWGDRGATPPSLRAMKIPDRPNIEVVWINNASHSLLVERPGEVASAIARFVEKP